MRKSVLIPLSAFALVMRFDAWVCNIQVSDQRVVSCFPKTWCFPFNVVVQW
jgi:hypothetical protein